MLPKILAFLYIFSISCFASDLIRDMSLEEKVGQVLMVHFNGDTINTDARILVQDTKVGGIIYYNWANSLTSPEQVQLLSAGLQNLAKNNPNHIPLLIATDQEGGVVARLQSGFTSFPGNRALGETLDPNLAKLAALATGREMLAVGVNMNLAPVVDVNSNPRNPIIGVRSFGKTPETVVAFGKKSLDGFREAHVISTLKHFPGHGDATVDSHEDMPVIRKSKEELALTELFPFIELAPFADAIMTAHILVPALDPQNCSTLSEITLNYLRNVIGFQGVIVADSLVMGGVLKKCNSVDEACIMALDAGCDLLILGGKLLDSEHAGFELTTGDVQRIHSSIIKAVAGGRISEDKLNRAVERILKLKGKYIDSLEKIDTVKNFEIAQKIASLSIKTSEKSNRRIRHLNDQKIFIISPEILESDLYNTTLFKIGKTTTSYFFKSLNPSKSDVEAALKQAESVDVIIVCSFNAWKNPCAIGLTNNLLSIDKPLILLSLRDPLDADLFSDADLIFKSFSPTIPSIQAICNQLKENHSTALDKIGS